MTHQLVEIARESIRAHLTGRSLPSADIGGVLPWGIFVSLHGPEIDGQEGPLRGCVGSLHLKGVGLEEEVGRVAVSSATADPRFPPLTSTEVDGLDITVYLLDPPEVAYSPADLDPHNYGIIVTGRGGRRGLLLPDLPGIDTPERQLEVATLKAGLKPDSEVTIEKFSAEAID